jgi:hypothetical protein
LALIWELQGEIKLLQGDAPAAKAAWQRGLDALTPVQGQFDKNPDCESQWKALQDCLKALDSQVRDPTSER